MLDTKTRILAEYLMFQNPNARYTVKDIISKLQREYGDGAERKTIYDDLCALTRFVPIEQKFENGKCFYVRGQTLIYGEIKQVNITDAQLQRIKDCGCWVE